MTMTEIKANDYYRRALLKALGSKILESRNETSFPNKHSPHEYINGMNE